MRFLTFPLIKAQLRLDDMQAEQERDLLELYGDAAEETVLTLIRRSLKNLAEHYNGVPAKLKQAALLLVAQSYQQREPASAQNMSTVPYTFDLLLKPYMRLAGEEYEGEDVLTDVYGDPILDANGQPIPLKPTDHETTAADVKLSMTAAEVRQFLEGRNKNGVIDTVPEVLDAMGGIDDDTELHLMDGKDVDDMMEHVLGPAVPVYEPLTRSVRFRGSQPTYDAPTRSVSGIPAEVVHSDE